MIAGRFANASAASPPAVYFAKRPAIIRLLSIRGNFPGLCLSQCHFEQITIFVQILHDIQPVKRAVIYKVIVN
jgi:hypothetical protein